MKLSIVLPVLNSHEVVRRQLLHFEKIGVPDDVEILIIDDGSEPPLSFPEFEKTLPLTIHQTNDTRPWSWPVARNMGVRLAKADHILQMDIDFILSRKALDTARAFDGDFMRFKREFGVLDENGDFTQDFAVLKQYGVPEERLMTKGVRLNNHRCQFVIHRDLYNRMGGFREDRIGRPYPQREDGDFAKKWDKLYEAGEINDFDDMHGYENREVLYMFPNGKYCEGGDVDSNPFNLFHTLTRKSAKNPYHHG